LDQCPWKEYETEAGRKYYHNPKSNETRWEVPSEYRGMCSLVFDLPACLPPLLLLFTEFMERRNRKKMLLHTGGNTPDDEVKVAFKQLLLDKGMSVNWGWEQAVSECKDDDRWKALKTSEKKHLFQELQSDMKRLERVRLLFISASANMESLLIGLVV